MCGMDEKWVRLLSLWEIGDIEIFLDGRGGLKSISCGSKWSVGLYHSVYLVDQMKKIGDIIR